jgi:hypothetical protein
MQVQSATSQTTVNYTDSTTITAAQVTDLSAVTVGECITAAAIPAGGAGGGSGAPSAAAPSASLAPSTAAPSGAVDNTGPLTATTVQLRDPVNGQCTNGFGGFGGNGPGGGGTPSGAPSAAPGSSQPGGTPSGGGPQNGQGFGGGGFGARAAFGTVASVTGDTVVVNQNDPQTQQASPREVTVTGSTTYTRTAVAAASALVVGQCAVVQGSTDNKGAVNATSIAVSAPPTGSTTCATGFGGGRGRNGGAAAPTTTGS